MIWATSQLLVARVGAAAREETGVDHAGATSAGLDDPVGTDQALTRRARLGDRDAFAAIVRWHGPAMFRYARTMMDGDVVEAEDAVQNALVKAWQHLPDFQGRSSLRTWLFRITANEVRSLRRRRRPVPVDHRLLVQSPAGSDGEPARVLDESELWRSLTVALGELPWRQRASWVLRELDGLSYDEIADVLGTSTTVVRGQLHRARGTLARRMEQWR